MAIGSSTISAEEYAELPDPHGYPTELVKGSVVTMVPPRPRHGEICLRIGHILQSHLDIHPTGRAVSNDSGVLTQRDPDTVRGADIAYYSFQRVPQGPLPDGLLDVAPEIVFEVLSPNDRWNSVQEKIDEYLQVGVLAVCVVDDQQQCIHLFCADQAKQIYKSDDNFSLPEILPEFSVPVAKFFS